MKKMRVIGALCVVLGLFALLAQTACAPGSLGNESIAFVRAGQLWTIDPDGANAFAVIAQDTGVLGYGLSPNHQIFVFRTLDSDFAKTIQGRHLTGRNPITGLVGDLPSMLNTVGIDGGSPIPIALSTGQLVHSDASWSPNSNRLLYREGADPALTSPDQVAWWISQNDQPAGIARKLLPPSYSIPSINAASNQAVGNAANGSFTTTLAGTELRFLERTALTGHPLSASLERLLWQPGANQPALLYAIATSDSQVELILRRANGEMQTLTTCDCRQFSWSPDGIAVLYSTNQGYTVLNIQTGSRFSFSAEHGAVPYWSPDSRAILLDGLHTLSLIHIAARQVQLLLHDNQPAVMTDGPLPDKLAFLQPVANNLWKSDGQHFVIVTRGRTGWLDQQSGLGNGLYVITLNGQDEIQGSPVHIDNNAGDSQPGWSYLDPNTSFLF